MGSRSGGEETTPRPTGDTEAVAQDFAAYRERMARAERRHRRDALVDQAVGVVIGRSGCGSAEAVAQLAAIARRSGRALHEVAADIVGEAAGTAADTSQADAVRLHPAIAGLDRSADGDELARSLVTEALGFSGPTAAVIGVLDDDGTVAILGSTGVPPREIRRWRRLPPAVDCLINRAVSSGQPVWIDDTTPDPPPLITVPGPAGSSGTRVAAPIRSGRMLIGVVELAWSAAGAGQPDAGARSTGLDPRARREVEAVVRSAGPALLRMLGHDLHIPDLLSIDSTGESPWQDVLDLFDVPAFVVDGLTDGSDTADRLQVIARNKSATEVMLADRSLTAAAPWIATEAQHLSAVARTGVPQRHRVAADRLGIEAVSVARVGPGAVLVVCHPATVPAPDVAATLERLAKFGTWVWNPAEDRVRWSPEALRIVGAPAMGDPGGIDRPPYTVHPDDAEAERRFIKTLTTEGRPAEVEFRIVHYGAEPTRVRMAGQALGGPGEAVFGVVQDVTEFRRAETALEVARVQLAAQRSRADAERHLASALQQAIVPSAARNQPPRTGVEIAARYRPASAAAGVGGDWYSVFPLRDAKLLLAIGDVAGHGLPAASAMADLHHGLRGIALAQTGPGRLLTLLNELVDGMPEFTIASACCLLWDPATRRLRWGNAGHPPPIRIRGTEAHLVEDHVGPMLGADPHAEYEDSAMVVESGDVLLLYTDGLVERRRVGDDETTSYLLGQAREPDADLDRYLDRILAGARSDTDDDVCVLAVRFD
ncbi:MAG: SpoIIE family protein phosphatase [Catenulisporales bacterium]|nr:SpoIIE family protein phosphatase [Catenulisporales bacterium]